MKPIPLNTFHLAIKFCQLPWHFPCILGHLYSLNHRCSLLHLILHLQLGWIHDSQGSRKQHPSVSFLGCICTPMTFSPIPEGQSICKVTYALHQYSMMLLLSHVQLFETLWTVACQVPLSLGFSRQEYYSRLLFPPPGDLPDFRN